jgi:hypothetical protein
MSDRDIDLAVQDYTANVQLLLQQVDSRFVSHVGSGNYVGKAAQVVDQVGAISATKVVGKYTPIGRTDTPNDQRWVYPSDYEVKPQMADSFDQLRLKVSLQGPFTQSAAAALARAKDDEIIGAFFADAKTGVDGGTTTSFGTTLYAAATPTGRNISVLTGGAAATGLNVAKLIAGMQALKSKEVDPSTDAITTAITATQEANLLSDVQVTSADFGWKDTPVLKNGELSFFLGSNFIRSERLQNGTSDSGTARMIPMWAKSGMHLGMWNDIKHSMSIRHDLTSEPWQVYSTATFGATRVEENKVVRIWAKES